MHTFTYHVDPGHGWLAVPATLLSSLGIADKVSGFSYLRDGIAYLEEDCDASMFLDAYTAREGSAPTVREAHTHGDSPIRRYPRYTVTGRA